MLNVAKNHVGAHVADPIKGAVHLENVGKVVVSTRRLKADSDDLDAVSTTFSLRDELHLRVYLRSTARYSLGRAGRLNCDEQQIEVAPANTDQWIVIAQQDLRDEYFMEATELVVKFPSRGLVSPPALTRTYESSGGPPRFGWQVIRHLKPGRHQFNLRYSLKCETAVNGSKSQVLASSTFAIVVEKGDVPEYLQRKGYTFPVRKVRSSASLKSLALRLAKKSSTLLKGKSIMRVRVQSKDWTYIHHRSTDAVVGRHFYATFVYKDPSSGECATVGYSFAQDKREKTWLPPYLVVQQGAAGRTIVCSPMPAS